MQKKKTVFRCRPHKNGFHSLNLHPKKYIFKEYPFFNANLLEKFPCQGTKYVSGYKRTRFCSDMIVTTQLQHVGAHMCLSTNVCVHKRVLVQTCVGTNVAGRKRVWAQTCLGRNVCGLKRVWAQTCVGTNVYGHIRVWAQSCGLKYV